MFCSVARKNFWISFKINHSKRNHHSTGPRSSYWVKQNNGSNISHAEGRSHNTLFLCVWAIDFLISTCVNSLSCCHLFDQFCTFICSHSSCPSFTFPLSHNCSVLNFSFWWALLPVLICNLFGFLYFLEWFPAPAGRRASGRWQQAIHG